MVLAPQDNFIFYMVRCDRPPQVDQTPPEITEELIRNNLIEGRMVKIKIGDDWEEGWKICEIRLYGNIVILEKNNHAKQVDARDLLAWNK